MLGAVKQQWEKVKNTSDGGFRVSFLQRSADLRCDNEQTWQMKVHERGYDVLLEMVPWTFKMIKHSWMEKMIVVEWK